MSTDEIDKIRDVIRLKLKKYIIDRDKYPHLPRTLDGEILLEERKRNGKTIGVVTASVENLAKIILQKDNPLLRPDEVVDSGKFKGRNIRDLTADEFLELTGWKRYFDKWKKKGITI